MRCLPQSGKCAWAAPDLDELECFWRGPGDFVPCGARAGALPLHPTAFEKAGETFIAALSGTLKVKGGAGLVKRYMGKTRAWAFTLALVMALALLPAAGRAVLSDVYFTAVNEQLLDLSSDTMPFWSGGVLYVPSRVFTGTDLGVSYVRNNTMDLVMLYTNRVDLRFDLEDQTAYDKRGNVYNGHAIERNGTVFFPLDLVCRYFGLTWSYSQTDTVPLVRIKSASGILDDTGFIDAAATQMASRYAAYEKSLGISEPDGGNTGSGSTAPDPPGVDTPPSQTIQAAEGQKVYLLLEADSRENVLEAMEILGNVQATFLLGLEELADGDLSRALIAGGHSIALRSGDGGAEEIERAQSLLWQSSCSWLDLVWCGGRADVEGLLPDAGCMPVTAALDRGRAGVRSAAQAENLLWSVGQHREDLAVNLGPAGNCTGGLDALVEALQSAGYRLCPYRS